MRNISDEQLLQGCKARKASYQKALYEKYKTPLFRVCLRYARDRSEAEDLLQDGFIKIFQDLHQYRGGGALGAWLRRVVVNVALQYIRKNKKMFPSVELDHIANQLQTNENVYAQMGAKTLTRLIQQLPAGYRAVFNMYAIEGYSHKEIAAQLNITVSTSKTQLFKAKKMLQGMVEKVMLE